MNLLRVIGQTGLVITVFIFTAAVTYGWPGLSHIIITKDADYPELKFYANGPDTYKSTQPWYEGGLPSNYFAWTHSRLTVYGFIGPIVDPNYKGPAYDMWILATRKLEGLSGQELDVARKTALGWCAHMAADRVVHWDYFPAPQDNNPLSLLIWLQHKNMESGVNILTYVDKVCGRNLEVAFNIVLDEQGNRVGGDGSVRLEGGHWDGYWPQWPGHWGLVSLAQGVYLKNQRKTDETDPETIWPETANVIRDNAHERLQELEDEIEDWTFGDFEDEIRKFDQLLTQPAESGTRTLHVKFVYSWHFAAQVQVFDSNGLLGDTGLIVSVDRHNRTITLDRDLSRDYPADGMSCVRYMPADDWRAYEPYWVVAVEAVRQQVPELEQQ